MDYHTFTDAHVLIQDRRFDMTVFPNPDGQIAARLFHIIVIRPHKNAILDHRSFCDLAANTNDGMRDLGFAYAAAFRDQHILQLTILYNRAWQIARMSIDRSLGIIKIEWRVGI